MNSLRQYIVEKFQVSKDNIKTYAYQPKDKDELIQCIKEKIEKEGLGTKDEPLDLNDIDTSQITDMSHLFYVEGVLKELSKNGYFDISDWDVSNVKNMSGIFAGSKFNGDISKWDVSEVKNMFGMFYRSVFFNGDISDWDVSKVEDFSWMFAHSIFNGDISKWNVKSLKYKTCTFLNSPLENNPPKWYNE